MTTGYPEDVSIARYERVTAAQVKAAANKYLDTGKLLTSALLPAEAVKPASKDAAKALSAFRRGYLVCRSTLHLGRFFPRILTPRRDDYPEVPELSRDPALFATWSGPLPSGANK